MGGRERLRGTWNNHKVSDFQCTCCDIVPDQRIVCLYEMYFGGPKISVSLATVEFELRGKGTHLRVTEQGVFLDGYDDAGSRERGTLALMDRLAESLRS